MSQKLFSVALVVHDYDDAIRYFTHCLRFTLIEDTSLSQSKRWVVVRPPGGGASLLLAKATSAEQSARVGDQTGGRVFLFLQSDDFWCDYTEMVQRGVRFIETPRAESYGMVSVFVDLYGNKWDLIQTPQTIDPCRTVPG